MTFHAFYQPNGGARLPETVPVTGGRRQNTHWTDRQPVTELIQLDGWLC